MMKLNIIFFTLLLSIQTIYSQNPVETFHRNGFNNSGTMELFDDNTFIVKFTASSCTGRGITLKEIHGTYELRKNHLKFSPTHKLYKGYEDEKLQRSNEYIREEGFFKFSYDIVEYKSNKILIAVGPLHEYEKYDFRFDNHYIYYANKLNKSDCEAYFDSDFWRDESDYKKPLIIEKDIKAVYPDHFKDYILEKPLVGFVNDVKEISFLNPDMESNPNFKKYRITLNIGKSDGVKPSMIFYGENDCNKQRCTITIQDVYEHESSGYTTNYSPQYNCSLEKKFSTKKEDN